MIKNSPNTASSISITAYSSMKQSPSYRNSVQFSPLHISSLYKKIDHYPSSTIIADSSEFEKLKQILEWRKNTDFPIVKIRSYRLQNEKQTLQCKFHQIFVQLECEMKSFDEINKLPFFQSIYVIKECMIGFERLCHRFGFFPPQPQMIKFNENQNCRVWINEDCFSNVTTLGNVKSERQFVLEVCNIVETQTIKSRNSVQFFERIRTCKYFFEAIGAIETYAKQNRIIIPNRLQNLNDVKSPLLKTSLNAEFKLKQNKSKNNLVVSSKIPQFIRKNKVKKTISFDVDFSLPRRMTVCTQDLQHDRSLTNISRNNSKNSFLKNDFQYKKIEEEDSFFKLLNVRFIEPKNYQINKICPSSPLLHSEYDKTTQSPFSPFGKVSQIDFDDDKKSGFSFHKCASKAQISSFDLPSRLFLTVNKPMNYNETYSSSPKKKLPLSPRDIKTLQYMDDQQSFEEISKPEVNQNKFKPLSITQIRQKRKFSADFMNIPIRIQTEGKLIEQEQYFSPQYKTHNILIVPNNGQRKSCLSKSPSQQVISRPRNNKDPQSDNQEIQQRQYLRENIMHKNGWKGLGLLKDQDIKESFVDNVQIPYAQSNTIELSKLGGMGRAIKSSMINECEFQLEYGDKIEKEKFVRFEVLNILN